MYLLILITLLDIHHIPLIHCKRVRVEPGLMGFCDQSYGQQLEGECVSVCVREYASAWVRV